MKANNDVTEALQRTIGLMQGELERSVLSTQLLGTLSHRPPYAHHPRSQWHARRVVYCEPKVHIHHTRRPRLAHDHLQECAPNLDDHVIYDVPLLFSKFAKHCLMSSNSYHEIFDVLLCQNVAVKAKTSSYYILLWNS